MYLFIHNSLFICYLFIYFYLLYYIIYYYLFNIFLILFNCLFIYLLIYYYYFLTVYLIGWILFSGHRGMTLALVVGWSLAAYELKKTMEIKRITSEGLGTCYIHVH